MLFSERYSSFLKNITDIFSNTMIEVEWKFKFLYLSRSLKLIIKFLVSLAYIALYDIQLSIFKNRFKFHSFTIFKQECPYLVFYYKYPDYHVYRWLVWIILNSLLGFSSIRKGKSLTTPIGPLASGLTMHGCSPMLLGSEPTQRILLSHVGQYGW